MSYQMRQYHIKMCRDAIKVQEKTSVRYKELLDEQLKENAKLQLKMDSTMDWSKKHPKDPKKT